MSKSVPENDDLLPPAPERKHLRSGWTTGSCAAAAAKAAVLYRLRGTVPHEVDIALPKGGRASFEVHLDENGRTYIIKDAGDDPDCTHGAHITASVHISNEPGPVTLEGGEGVGRVTLPGLGLDVGGPAINPVPRSMISEAVREVTDNAVEVTISVPGGEIMAQKTTNARLGIVGGISILGTTGIVRPFSTASFRASVVQQIDLAGRDGAGHIIFATGSRSEQRARSLFPELRELYFVEVGDFTSIAIKRAHRNKVNAITWVGMAGKVSKLAQGTLMTHFHRSHLDTEVLVRATLENHGSPTLIEAARATTTARHFAEVCLSQGDTSPLITLAAWARDTLVKATHHEVEIEVIMVDFDAVEVLARV
jgi:cobalt-precorrin-5B (C1)-methyltransferase